MATMSESRTTLTPWERVFQTPELAFLILGHIELKHIPLILTTCRALFYPAAASTWKHTTNASPLFQLLPCTEVRTLRRLPAKFFGRRETGKNFTFSKPLLDSDFRRFSIYAPFITRLDIYKDSESTITVSRWNYLLDYVHSGHVLLPNLSTLVIKSNDSRRGMLPYPWVIAFASPSLRNLRIGWGLRVSHQVGCAILDHLMRLCIELSTLELYIVPDEMEEQDECVLPMLDMVSRDYVTEYLDSATTLKSLSISLHFYCEYSYHICRLPRLRRLEVEFYWTNVKVAGTGVPKNEFPVLEELQLAGFSSSDIESSWVTSPMAKNITTFDVIRANPSIPAQFDSELSLVVESLSHFITICLQECPKLTVLRLEFERSMAINPLVKIDGQALQLLSQHPLCELSVRGIAVADALENYAVQRVTSLLTSLEVLWWPDLLVSLHELHCFTRMTRLQTLAIHLEAATLTLADMRTIPWLRGVPNNPELNKLVSVFTFWWNEGEWFRFASYISHIWPNIQLATAREYNPIGYKSGFEVRHVDIANAYMRLLRYRGRGGRRDRMRAWMSVGGALVESELDV